MGTYRTVGHLGRGRGSTSLRVQNAHFRRASRIVFRTMVLVVYRVQVAGRGDENYKLQNRTKSPGCSPLERIPGAPNMPESHDSTRAMSYRIRGTVSTPRRAASSRNTREHRPEAGDLLVGAKSIRPRSRASWHAERARRGDLRSRQLPGHASRRRTRKRAPKSRLEGWEREGAQVRGAGTSWVAGTARTRSLGVVGRVLKWRSGREVVES